MIAVIPIGDLFDGMVYELDWPLLVEMGMGDLCVELID
jgi:hypothetical protein